MSKYLRQALETVATRQPEEKMIVMQGPLAEVFTQALQQAYAKQDPSDNPSENAAGATAGDGVEPALESAAQDAQLLGKLLDYLAPPQPAVSSPFVVYGVKHTDVEPETFVEVTNTFQNAEGPEHVIVIADHSDGSPPATDESSIGPKYVELNRSLEHLVTKLGGRYYHSLEAFVLDTVK